jgi:hypothetical protein
MFKAETPMWHIVKKFLFGGDPSVMTYSISLLFEGIVSAVIVTFMLMLYWDTCSSDKHGAES